MSTWEILGTVLGAGGAGAALMRWRERRDVSREQSATAVVKPLLDRVGALEQRTDAQAVEIVEVRGGLSECKEAHAECEGRVVAAVTRADEAARKAAELAEHVTELQALVRRSDGAVLGLAASMRALDDTGVHRLGAEIEQRMSTPIPRPLPPPPRRDAGTSGEE